MSFVKKVYAAAFAPLDDRPIWEWAAEKIDFGNSEAFKGKYDVNNVPWTREILRAFKDPIVREITAVMPPQESGKTKAAEVCLSWRICNAPGKLAFNAMTNKKAEHWNATRWNQMLECVNGIKDRYRNNRVEKTKARILFKDGTYLIIQGAEEPANRQSDSFEVQINDELHLWQRPWHKQMKTRLRAYKDTRKILNISVGGQKNSELDEAFLEGSQGEWSHHCPGCSKLFQYVFRNTSPKCNIRFDLSKAILKDDGTLDLTEFEPTVRVVCPHCSLEMRYDEDRLAAMNRAGEYVWMNPAAPKDKVSLHVNSFALGRRPWVQILEPWVKLNLRGGVFARDLLENFVCEELAEMFEDRPVVVTREIRLGSYRRNEIALPGMWKDEFIRVGGVDNQRGQKGDVPHRWFNVRAFARDGRSRLVDCGRIDEWPAVQARMRALGVREWSEKLPGPWVVCDRRHNPVEVDEVCADFKWYGMMGSDQEEFLHSTRSIHAGKRMLFTEERTIDIGFGEKDQGRKYAIYYLYSTTRLQDMLATLLAGKAEQFEVFSDIMDYCPEYATHLNSHRQKIETTKKGQDRRIWERIGGHPDHLRDCELQTLVCALMAGIYKP